MWLMNRIKKFKFAIKAFQAFGDLQTTEKSVENLDKRLARFFANYFFIFCMKILVFRYISFIEPPLGGFKALGKYSSLQEIFRRIRHFVADACDEFMAYRF